MGNPLKKLYSFLRFNKNRRMYPEVLFLSAFYRFRILFVPMKKLQKRIGIMNEESAGEESEQHYRQAARISHVVNRICSRTPWESKCLVRALTAQHLLRRRRIPSTLYLGVGKKDDGMIAHAWLRCGKYFVIGGNGESYAMVAKFRA